MFATRIPSIALSLIVCFAIAMREGDSQAGAQAGISIRGFSAMEAKTELAWEQKMLPIPRPDLMHAYQAELASAPHHVGSPKDRANAEWLLAKFKSFGLQASIEEFQVLSSNYQAEYGRAGGGEIKITSRSGTKDFHGTAYFFHRHEGMNANTFFRNADKTSRAFYRYNYFGYNIGGPVKLGNFLKDKMYFFWGQEWHNQLVPATSANQPTTGPPMVVEPRNDTVQKDMTRPRICGELSSCKMLLPSEEKLIEQIPTSTMASAESSRLGMKAAARTANPNSRAALISL